MYGGAPVHGASGPLGGVTTTSHALTNKERAIKHIKTDNGACGANVGGTHDAKEEVKITRLNRRFLRAKGRREQQTAN
jgi:hypothetical protein